MSGRQAPTLTLLERQRIVEILAAISAKDWLRFETLSDELFINPSSMREQFDDSISKVSNDLDDWESATTIDPKADGTRLIWINLPGKTPEKPPIHLIVHSTKAGISIWVFYEQYQP